MIQVLLIGLGEVGDKHLEALQSLPEAQVCGVVEPSQHRLREALWPGVPWFADHYTALRENVPARRHDRDTAANCGAHRP